MRFRFSVVRFGFSVVAIAAWVLFPHSASAVSPTVHHPLDALTPQEYWTIYETLRAEGHVHEKTLFGSILLHEPDKQSVLKWSPGTPIDRKTDVVLLDEGKSYASIVDITSKKSILLGA